MDDTLFDDISYQIKEASAFREPAAESRYHKHREYLAYGLKTSELWRIMKSFRPRYSALPFSQKLDLNSRLLGTGIGELGHGGIFLLGISAGELTPQQFPYLDRLIDDFHSWSHVDHFCSRVLQSLLSSYPNETLSQLDRWSQAENRFRRRCSVVAFTGKIGSSGQFTAKCLEMCDKLIWDEQDIVRKGVGWALKENMRSAPEQVLDYVKNLRRMGVSSTITLYAIRNLEESQRQEVLAIKKVKDNV